MAGLVSLAGAVGLSGSSARDDEPRSRHAAKAEPRNRVVRIECPLRSQSVMENRSWLMSEDDREVRQFVPNANGMGDKPSSTIHHPSSISEGFSSTASVWAWRNDARARWISGYLGARIAAA